jgi:DNA-binding MarR family transcriptional regulator
MQETDVSTEQLAAQVARFFATAMRTAQTEVFQLVAELDLSMTQLKILHILDGSHHELTPSELAQFVGLSPAATGRAVDAMARAGLVSRRDDEEDRRVKRLTLTDAGLAAVTRITEARVAGLAHVVADLDADQRAALSAALAPLLSNAPQTPRCSS